MDDELFFRSMLLSSTNCRQLYDELTEHNNLFKEKLRLEQSLKGELKKLQDWHDVLKGDSERMKRFVQNWTSFADANVCLESAFRTMLFGKNAIFLEQDIQTTIRKPVSISDIKSVVKHLIVLLVDKKFIGHKGGTDLDELKKDVVKQQGHLNPSVLFIAGLFGKKSPNWSVEKMDYVPPDVLSRRIEVAIDEHLDRLGGPDQVQFNSNVLGSGWIKNVFSQRLSDGVTDKLDLLCKTGKRFGDCLKNESNELGFNMANCEYHPLKVDVGAGTCEQKDGMDKDHQTSNKSGENVASHVVDLGSLFKIDRFMPKEFTENFKRNAIKKLPFAKHPDTIRSGNRTCSRLVRFVSTVPGTVMHIGGTDGEFFCSFSFDDCPLVLFFFHSFALLFVCFDFVAEFAESGSEWAIESVYPCSEEMAVLDQMNLVKEKVYEKTKEELILDNKVDKELIPGFQNVFKKDNALWCQLGKAKDSLGHGSHQDGSFNSSHTMAEATQMWDKVRDLVDSQSLNESLIATSKLKLPFLPQQMLVQTWILQNVDVQLAKLVTTQKKNDDKTNPVASITTCDNQAHVQGYGNQVRAFHSVVENINMSMNDDMPDHALRMSVRSMCTMDDTLDECNSRFANCVSGKNSDIAKCSHASHCLHIDFYDEKHGSGDLSFNFIGCPDNKRNDGPMIDVEDESANKRSRSGHHVKFGECKFRKEDASPDAVSCIEREDCSYGQVSHRMATREKAYQVLTCKEMSEFLRRHNICVVVKHRRNPSDTPNFKRKINALIESTGVKLENNGNVTSKMMLSALKDLHEEKGCKVTETGSPTDSSGIDLDKDGYNSVLCGPCLRADGTACPIGYFIKPGVFNSKHGIVEHLIGSMAWNAVPELNYGARPRLDEQKLWSFRQLSCLC